eukprot:1284686-Alexandrium_andersonii.AAC.1
MRRYTEISGRCSRAIGVLACGGRAWWQLTCFGRARCQMRARDLPTEDPRRQWRGHELQGLSCL